MLTLLIALAAAAPAVAAADPGRIDPKMMRWQAFPNGQQFAAAYPKNAIDHRIQGMAIVDCEITASGRLTDCNVLGQEPADRGFGEAALQLTVYFKARATTKDGKATAGRRVTVPIRFTIG